MSTIKKSAMILALTYDSFTYPRYQDLSCCNGIISKIKLIQDNGKFINLDYYVRFVNQVELEAISWMNQKRWEDEKSFERYGWSYKHNLIDGRHA